jgi:hypothetical protein
MVKKYCSIKTAPVVTVMDKRLQTVSLLLSNARLERINEGS